MYGNLGIDARSWDPLANLLPLADLAEVTRRVREDIVRIAGGARRIASSCSWRARWRQL